MTTAAPLPAPERAGVFAEGRNAVFQIGGLARDGFACLPRLHRSPVRALVLAIWMVGITGDALTTILMMRTGLFEEANGAAAFGMGSLGSTGYVVVVSAVCALMAVTSLGRPSGLYARTAVAVLLLIGLGKVYIAASNYLLYLSVLG